MAEKFEFSDILAEARQVLAEHTGYCVMVVAMIAGGYVVLDLISDKGGNFGSVVVTVFVQYLFLEHVLLGPQQGASSRRYGALFGSSFLSTLGILVGSVFLILPGIYLAARWALTSAFVVAERNSTLESLAASWKATRGSAWSIFAVQLVFVIAVAILLAVAVGLAFVLQPLGSWVESVLLNLVVAAFSVGGWILAVAIFRLARPDQSALSEVFG